MGGGINHAYWSEPWKNNYTRVYDDAASSVVHTQVWAVAEGADGYVFFATNDGLCVWDGVRWRSYRNPSNNILRALFYDLESHRLYCAGVNEFGYWQLNDCGLFTYTSLFRNENFRQINYEFWRIVAPDDKSGIYFQSFYKIYRYNPYSGDEGHAPEIESMEPADIFRYMFLDRGKVYYQDGTAFCAMPSFGGREFLCDVDDRIVNVYRNSKCERVVLLEHSGLAVLDDRENMLPLDKKTNLLLKKAHITCSNEYDSTHILVGTTNGGVFIINTDSGQIEDSFIYNEDGIYDNAVLSVSRDTTGNIWMGMNSGVIRIMKNNDEFYIRSRILGKVNSMLECDDGTLLLGTTRGLFKAGADGSVSVVGSLAGPVWELVRIDNAVLILHDSGVYTFAGGIPVLSFRTNGALHIERFPDEHDCFLVGEYNGLSLMRVENGTVHSVSRIENNHIYSNNFRIDESGRVWLPVSDREFICLSLSEDKRMVTAMKNYQLLSDDSADGHVFCSNIGSELVICAGTTAYSIDYDLDTLVRHNAASLILQRCSDHVRELVQYDNNFWYISDSDIGYIRQEGDVLTKYSGMFEAIPADRRMDGRLMWVGNTMAIGFSGGAGFFTGSGRVSENPQLGSVAALGVDSDVLYYDMREPVFRIPNSMSLLRIYPVHLGAGRTIEYRMDDFPWQTERIDDYIQFISLPYGHHTISLRMPGQSDPDHWINLSVYRKRPWYISIGAIVMYILTTVFLTLLCEYYVKLWRRHHEELRSLTLKVDEMSSDLREASKKLANIAMEKINNNRGDADCRQHIEQYFNVIYDGMLDKLVARYPQLSKTDLKLCAYMKLNLSTKEIAELMNISPRSVEQGRYRLRKKMQLSPDESLSELLQQF